MPQESLLKPKKMNYLKMVSSVFTIRTHYKGLFGGFFHFAFAGGLEIKAVSWVKNSLSGIQKEAAKTRAGQDGGHQVPNENQTTDVLDRSLGKNEIGKFLKEAFAAAKRDDTNKKKVGNDSFRKTSVGGFLEADVQPNFVAQLSGHDILKSLDSYHSASLKRRREMSAILNREPTTSAGAKEEQVSISTTKQQNVFTVQQIKPRAIFPERALTSSKAAHSTSTFSLVISGRSQGWMKTDRWAMEAFLTLHLHFC